MENIPYPILPKSVSSILDQSSLTQTTQVIIPEEFYLFKA